MDKPVNIYETVMEHLRSRRISREKIAKESGVPFSTLNKIAQGDIEAPSVHAIQKLYDYFTVAARSREAA